MSKKIEILKALKKSYSGFTINSSDTMSAYDRDKYETSVKRAAADADLSKMLANERERRKNSEAIESRMMFDERERRKNSEAIESRMMFDERERRKNSEAIESRMMFESKHKHR